MEEDEDDQGGLGMEDDEDDQGGLGVDDEDDQGGLGVEDDHHKIISFCGVGLKRGFFLSKPRTLGELWGNQIEIPFAVVLDFLRKTSSLCLSGCKSVCKILGPVFEA